MDKVKVANLNISALTTKEFLLEIERVIKSDQQAFITTPNSEFLYAALRSKELCELFNSADIALADGIAIFLGRTIFS
jgi:UDP-N-acetyl-D-mannosaminuronic acid transferase (WecB/TagA/CpsF family)